MQSVPRFSVVDRHQRPIPDLNPIDSLVDASLTNVPVNDDPEELLQTQIKLNAELMKRVEALGAEKTTLTAEVKALQAAVDQSKKETAFYKIKFEESSAELDQLKKKGKGKIDSDSNKENLNNSVQQNNATN